MNLVGKEGRGESVWLAFFLYDVLTQFAELARAREDVAFAERCLAQAKQLQENIEATRLGRPMVSPRLLRQRRTARLADQSGMSDRFPAAKLVGASAAPAIRSARARRWTPWTSAWSVATQN